MARPSARAAGSRTSSAAARRVDVIRPDRPPRIGRGDVRGHGTRWHRARHVPDRVHGGAGERVRKGVGQRERRRRRRRVHPGTDAEAPWLFDAGCRSSTATYAGEAPFADNERCFIYRFPLEPDMTGGTLRRALQAELLVQVSSDGQTWRTVLEETERTDGSNRGWRELDLAELARPARRSSCGSQTPSRRDGWGGWLARLRLEQQAT